MQPRNSKATSAYRVYSDNKSVEQTYRDMQQQQTLFFGKLMRRHFVTKAPVINIPQSLDEMIGILNGIIDASDPDVDFPQIFHAFQTAEALRHNLNEQDPTQLKDIDVRSLFTVKDWASLPDEIRLLYSNQTIQSIFPHITDWSWLPLIGFLHDFGKVLASPAWCQKINKEKDTALPQWAVVGDTFPVGAPFSSSNVHADKLYFISNPDLTVTTTDQNQFGIYPQHCGFNQLIMSFGHDQYGFELLKKANTSLPDEALYIVFLHSFYPWHTPQNGKRAYTELASKIDWLRLPLLKLFQKSDLYSKEALPNIEEAKKICDALYPHYCALLEKFIPPSESPAACSRSQLSPRNA